MFIAGTSCLTCTSGVYVQCGDNMCMSCLCRCHCGDNMCMSCLCRCHCGDNTYNMSSVYRFWRALSTRWGRGVSIPFLTVTKTSSLRSSVGREYQTLPLCTRMLPASPYPSLFPSLPLHPTQPTQPPATPSRKTVKSTPSFCITSRMPVVTAGELQSGLLDPAKHVN